MSRKYNFICVKRFSISGNLILYELVEIVTKCGEFAFEVISSEEMFLNPIGERAYKKCIVDKYKIYHRGASDSWHLTVGYVRFQDDGKADVRCIDYSPDTPKNLHRLRNGLRLGLKFESDGRYMIELSQARLNDNGRHSNLYMACLDEICDAAKIKIADFNNLMEKLKIKITTRFEAHKSIGPRGNYLICFVDPKTKIQIVFYIITRVAPLFYGIKSIKDNK